MILPFIICRFISFAESMAETLSQGTSFESIILTVLAVVIIVIVVGCMYTFIHAIILFVFASSKEENKKKWRNAIRFMVIGVIFTIVLLFSFPFLFKVMSVPDYAKYTPQNIFGRAWELINGAFKLWNFIKESQIDNQYRGNLYYDANQNTSTDMQNTTDWTNYDL